MKSRRKRKEIPRREFLGRSATAIAALGFSSSLLNAMKIHTGVRTGSIAEDFILPEEVLRKAIRFLVSKGVDFGDVFVERSAFDILSSDDRKINTSTTFQKGVGIRGVKEGKTFYAYTASFEPDEIYKTARFVADAAAQGQAGERAVVVDLTSQSSDLSFPIVPLPDEVAPEKKIEMIKGLTQRAWSADKRVIQVSLYFQEFLRLINIATSNGKIVNKTVGGTLFYALTYMKDDAGNLQLGLDTRGAYAGLDFFTGENSFEVVVDKSVERARKMLKATDSPRGIFPVVLGPGSTGVLFHESCGHGMEADLVYKGSNYKGQLGKQTSAKGVTLIDDGTIPEMLGSYTFDDEGTPSQRTVLIHDGIQENYLCDLIWAEKLGLKSSGSGRRQSFRFPPIPRMRNTFIDAGDIAPEDIIASTKKGIYVAQVGGGGEVDVITGNFMMGVAEAYLIENGEMTYPIRVVTIGGNLFEFLKCVDKVGDDLTWIQATGCPTFSVKDIKIGGA